MVESRLKHTLAELPGKVRCLTIPIPASRSITLLVLVKVGSRYEEAEHSGISHFMEHMFFKGAKRYPDTMAVAGAIDGAGGNFNAYTGEEMVGYYVKISSARKKIAYDVLSDMLLNSKFDSEEIGREKGVIIEEIRMHHDDPMSQVYQDFHSLAFGNQPLGWDIAGTEEVVTSMERNHFLHHHESFYHGANCVITCAGDTTSEEHEALCKEFFTFQNGGDESQPEPWEKLETPRINVRFKETEQAHFIFGFHSCAAEHEDLPPLKVLNTILGGAMSSRLFYQIRERRGLAYYISSGLSTYQDIGLMQVNAGVNLNKVNEALACALAEVEKIKNEPVTDEEIDRAKQNMLGQTDLALEDSRRVASFYGARELLYRKIKTPEDIETEIKSVTKEQILDAANKYFRDENIKLALIGPFKDDKEVSGVLKLG